MALQRNRRDATFDYNLRMKDSYAVAATSAAAQVASADKILDMGAGRVDGRVLIDISAIVVTTGDEKYEIIVQGSTSATFANGVWNLGALILGDSSVSLETVDSVVRHQELAFCNEVNGNLYRYLRLYTFTAGNADRSITYTGNLVKA